MGVVIDSHVIAHGFTFLVPGSIYIRHFQTIRSLYVLSYSTRHTRPTAKTHVPTLGRASGKSKRKKFALVQKVQTYGLQLEYEGPGIERQAIPGTALSFEGR